MASFAFYGSLVAFDHVRQRLVLIAQAEPGSRAAFDRAQQVLDGFEEDLGGSAAPPGARRLGATGRSPAHGRRRLPLRRPRRARSTSPPATSSRSSSPGSTRWTAASTRSPSTGRCACVNPSPYMFFLELRRAAAGRRLARRCWCASRAARSRPGRSPARGRAGTRPRTTTRSRASCWPTRRSGPSTSCWSTWAATTSAASAAPARCRSAELMEVERYSHVMHIVSSVVGRARARARTRSTPCAATLPGGDASPARRRSGRCRSSTSWSRSARGPYAGAVGYLDLRGNLDFCIAIRTLVLRAGKATLQAGAGIVADSDPAAEERETRSEGRRRCSRRSRVAGGARMILLIDNYDSFTYNLVQYLGELGRRGEGRAQRRAERRRQALALRPERIVISPGPGTPDEAGICLELIRRSPGAAARRLPRPPGPRAGLRRQGRARAEAHARQDLRDPPRRRGRSSPACPTPSPRPATTRWSWPGERAADCLRGDGLDGRRGIMGLRHRELPVEGVQFHPESILTTAGKDLLRNFLGLGAKVSVKRHLGEGAPAAERLAEDEAAAAMGSIMDGEATPAQIGALLGALAARGRDRGRDGRLRPGDARARGAASARRARSTPAAPAATARAPSTSRPRRRSWSPARRARGQARQPLGRRRAAAAPTCWRPSASASTRRCRACSARWTRRDRPSSSRPLYPPGDAPRGLAAPGDGRAHRLQPARAADQPGRRPRAR